MHRGSNNNCPMNADPRNESCACDAPWDQPSKPQPTNEQLYALQDYAAEHGRNWKSKLRHEWETGQQSGLLQQVRNNLGPSWLVDFKLPRRS